MTDNPQAPRHWRREKEKGGYTQVVGELQCLPPKDPPGTGSDLPQPSPTNPTSLITRLEGEVQVTSSIGTHEDKRGCDTGAIAWLAPPKGHNGPSGASHVVPP